MESELELIKHASCRAECGFIVIGKHHAQCFAIGRSMGMKMAKGRENQGFMTSKGRWVSREEGGHVAYSSQQIDKTTTLLFSENMWSDMYSAKHDYDVIKGYILREDS